MEDDELICSIIMEEERLAKRKRGEECEEDDEVLMTSADDVGPVFDDDSNTMPEAFPLPRIVTTEDLDDFMELMSAITTALKKYERKHVDRENFPGHRTLRTAVHMIWKGQRAGLDWLDMFTGFSFAHAAQKDINAHLLAEMGLSPSSQQHNQ